MSRAVAERRIAVIDIGSNSVRLVIFAVSNASMMPVFNEKVMAGLGRGLTETGWLSPAGRVLALAALARFRSITDALEVREVEAVATAAARVAEDGPDFAREAEGVLGIPLRILSGADEGRLSARGVAAGFFEPDGLVADLGGSSLELHAMGPHRSPLGETHMLGPLALAELANASEKQLRTAIRKQLASSNHLKEKNRTLFAVGGAWRAFAKVAMRMEKYPLRVLHGYSLTPELVKRSVSHVQSKRGSGDLSTIAGRRGAQLHVTSIVLDEVLRACGAASVVVSSYGLREGVVNERLGLEGADPLADGIRAFASLSGEQEAFGAALLDFVRPVFLGTEPELGSWAREMRLHAAACLLADASGKYHPDHRHEMAFEEALYAPMAGIDHTERVFIAATLGWRYSRSLSFPKSMQRLLAPNQQKRARQLGQVMRLGAVFSGRSARILVRARLEIDDTRLIFNLGRQHAAMVSEIVERRLANAASALDRKPEIVLA